MASFGHLASGHRGSRPEWHWCWPVPSYPQRHGFFGENQPLKGLLDAGSVDWLDIGIYLERVLLYRVNEQPNRVIGRDTKEATFKVLR